jgi:CRP/FNR family cyclic AMP-dependent transcriptional regulator
MAVKRTVVMEKKVRKTPRNQRVPLGSATAGEVLSGPVASGTPPERTAAFDPRLFLTKLTAGKTDREYQGNESVFSQGDAADAVFYIQSGKVKLTVVSKRGKEAVVAILPEASFFGEGWANRFAWPLLAQSSGAASFGWRSR